LKVAAAAPYPQEPPATTTTDENQKPEPVGPVYPETESGAFFRTGEGERGGVVCGLGAVAGGREGEQLREQGEREQKR
jgi:hypothetical protein